MLFMEWRGYSPLTFESSQLTAGGSKCTLRWWIEWMCTDRCSVIACSVVESAGANGRVKKRKRNDQVRGDVACIEKTKFCG